MKHKIITVACLGLSLLVFTSCVFGAKYVEPEAAKPPASKPAASMEAADIILVSSFNEEEGGDVEACPFTEEEIVMLAQTMYQESQVLVWYGDQWGVSYIARQAAVGWCALNRYDDGNFGDTLKEVLSKPYQFAWSEDAPVTDHFLALARDIVFRWQLEKQGETDVGRTLPGDYFFFEGDGKENYFRKEHEHTGGVWDWSLPDPYGEKVIACP